MLNLNNQPMKKIIITKKLTTYDSLAFRLYLQDVSRLPILTPKEELMYATRAANGDKKAEELLITCNLRFVISVAKLYLDDNCRLEDLVNEGNEGLIIAARRFDPTTGFKFISFAVWWIRHTILLYKTNVVRLIRVPNNKLIDANKVKEAEGHFELKFNREPTDLELQEILGETITDKRMQQIYEINNTNIKSLDFQIDSDGGTYKDILADNVCDPTDHSLMVEDEAFLLKSLLDILTPIQKKIIVLSYGLNGDGPMCLAEVGTAIGRSRERVRQIKDAALATLQAAAKKQRRTRHYAE